MNVAGLLCKQAETRPRVPAIVEQTRGRSRITTFAELDQAAGQVASLLSKQGLRPGDAVLVLQPMSTELYIALAAIFRLGLVAMFLDPSAGQAHIERCCAVWPPRGFIASTKAQLLRLRCRALRRIPVNFVIGLPVPGAMAWKRYRRATPLEQLHHDEPHMPALLTFTSGSTGDPHVAVRSHALLQAQHEALARVFQLRPDDVCLTTLPIALLSHLAAGITSLLPSVDLRRPGAFPVAPVVKQIEAHQATRVIGSPAFIERLTDYCIDQKLTLPGLRSLITGGGPVFPRLAEKVSQAAPGAELTAIYGSTEAEPIAHLAAHRLTDVDRLGVRTGSGLLAGEPVREVELRIITDRWENSLGPCTEEEFSRLCQPAGLAGEIVVSGRHVLNGYLHGWGDEETKIHVAGTVWHRTGDAGYLDDGGRLWLLGRCSACIRDHQGVMYPLQVEAAAHECVSVKRAALVSCSRRRVLVVETSGAVTHVDEAALKQDLSWAHLDDIQLCAHIPVDGRHNSKIDYPALRRLLEKQPPGNHLSR